MSSAAGMLAHTASTIVVKDVPVSHDLSISGFSATKNCYTDHTYRYIHSAKFVAGARRLYLRYYPNGRASNDWGVRFLLCHDRDSGAGEEKVPVYYRITLLGPDGNPLRQYQQGYRIITYDDEPSPVDEPDGLISRMMLDTYVRDDAFSVRCEFCIPMIVTQKEENEEPPPSGPTRTHVPADVHESLVRYISDEVPTDVAIEVGAETYRAHRGFLSAQSPVFAAMFAGPMRENTAPSLQIGDMEPRVFKAMLDFIYTGNQQLPPPVDDEEGDGHIAMTQHLLVAADRYDLERLKSICAEKLRTHINTSIVATTLDLAHRHGCHALKDACFDFLAPHRGNLKGILNSDGFVQLVIDFPSVVVELLARVAPSPR